LSSDVYRHLKDDFLLGLGLAQAIQG
jgi:hypothetical protein